MNKFEQPEQSVDPEAILKNGEIPFDNTSEIIELDQVDEDIKSQLYDDIQNHDTGEGEEGFKDLNEILQELQ